MKRFLLFKCEDEKIILNLKDKSGLYKHNFIKPLSFNEILNTLNEYDYRRNDLNIYLDHIEYKNQLTKTNSRIYTEGKYTVLEEEDSSNFLRLLLLRLGRMAFLDYGNIQTSLIEKKTSMRY